MFKRKKGFTLIEIIVCIGLISIIGVSSFFGIRLVNRNIKISKLEQITDKALLAAEVYIETNKETYNQLHNKKNSVVIPLNVLVNEGLLDISTTTLEDKDIKDEYVITALTNGGGNNQDCINITANASWTMNNSSPLYICTNSSTGSSNLATISTYDTGNLNVVAKEPYYFSGDYVNNYIKINDEYFQILYVDSDDSIVIYSKNRDKITTKISNDKLIESPYELMSREYYYVFSNAIFPIYCSNNKVHFEEYTLYYKVLMNTGKYDTWSAKYGVSFNSRTAYNKISYIDRFDVLNATNCEVNSNGDTIYNTWMTSNGEISCNLYNSESSQGVACQLCQKVINNQCKSWDEQEDKGQLTGFKAKLKSCMKITGGTGDYATPFILEDRCS